MLDRTPNLWYNNWVGLAGAEPKTERLEMTTSNSKQFLVDITEHFIEIDDRSQHFNMMTHVIKDTEHYKAGDTVLIHTFQDVNGFDRHSLTVWHDGQCLRTRINN